MTDILKVILEYCDQYVDDLNLEELKVTDFPLYAYKMWGYLRASIPLFNNPENMQTYFFGTPTDSKLIAPLYTSETYTATQDETTDFSVNFPEFKDYSFISCRKIITDQFGDVEYVPFPISFDSTDGTVTFKATEENPVNVGDSFDFDLYTDGKFLNLVTPEMMSVLGFCFAYVWETRFINNWLSNIPKIEDSSFKEQNRANNKRADTERIKEIRAQKDSAIRRFSENAEIRTFVPSVYRNMKLY